MPQFLRWFFSTAVISRIEFIGGGEVGGGLGGWRGAIGGLKQTL